MVAEILLPAVVCVCGVCVCAFFLTLLTAGKNASSSESFSVCVCGALLLAQMLAVPPDMFDRDDKP